MKDKEYDISLFRLSLEFLGAKEESDAVSDDNDDGDSDEEQDLIVNTGRWSRAEVARLNEGIDRFQNDFKAVARVVGTRNNKQVSAYLKYHPNVLKKRKRHPAFSATCSSKVAKWLDQSSIVASRLVEDSSHVTSD